MITSARILSTMLQQFRSMLIAGIDTLTGKILHYNVHVLFRAILVTDIFCSHGQSRLKLYAFKLLHSVYIF